MNKTVLVVVAHSDDETLSMAGTIRKHIKHGDKVYVVSMTDGVSARENSSDRDVIERENSASSASKILGFDWGDCHKFKDNALDASPILEVVKAVDKAKLKYKPSLVYTHSGADLNVDHRVVANAVLTSFRPQPGEVCKELRLFEVVSSTDFGHPAITGSFSPNLFIDVSNEWSDKIKALNAYAGEMRDYPHSRSIEGVTNLAKSRGSQVGYKFAEAFEIIRKLE